LGLAIAREVVEHHGGTIAWCRRDDMTCFTVELPTVDAEKEDVSTAGRR
jgi:signal transduction histidine kinase